MNTYIYTPIVNDIYNMVVFSNYLTAIHAARIIVQTYVKYSIQYFVLQYLQESIASLYFKNKIGLACY